MPKPISPEDITRLAAEIQQDPERFREAFEDCPEQAEEFLGWLDAYWPVFLSRAMKEELSSVRVFICSLNTLLEAQARKILEDAENAREEAACDAAADKERRRDPWGIMP